ATVISYTFSGAPASPARAVKRQYRESSSASAVRIYVPGVKFKRFWVPGFGGSRLHSIELCCGHWRLAAGCWLKA
ncbi:MAG: hypothetical protein PVF25_04010, partial [Desulfobacterales bacterium]